MNGNIIVANKVKDLLQLEIDLIKAAQGEYEAEDIVKTFSTLIYDKLILDVSAIRGYQNIINVRKVTMAVNKEKLILVLPEGDVSSTPSYLSELISFGVYNFTSTVDGVKRLLERSNTLEDVKHITELNTFTQAVGERVESGSNIIGIRNITANAGSTTLIYMLKKELERMFGPSIYAIEVNRNDFSYFNDKNMISTNSSSLRMELNKLEHAAVILIDLNDHEDETGCSDVLYLLEPSSIKIGKLIKSKQNVFQNLQGKKVILNQSMLDRKDIIDFEFEAKTKFFYTIPPLDDRKKNDVLTDFMRHLGVLENKKEKSEGKILGLFKR